MVVLVFTSKHVLGPVPKPEFDSDSDEYKAVWAEIENSNGKNLLICVHYITPVLALNISPTILKIHYLINQLQTNMSFS